MCQTCKENLMTCRNHKHTSPGLWPYVWGWHDNPKTKTGLGSKFSNWDEHEMRLLTHTSGLLELLDLAWQYKGTCSKLTRKHLLDKLLQPTLITILDWFDMNITYNPPVCSIKAELLPYIDSTSFHIFSSLEIKNIQESPIAAISTRSNNRPVAACVHTLIFFA